MKPPPNVSFARMIASAFVLFAGLLASVVQATIHNVSTSAQLVTALSSVVPGDTIRISGTITSTTTFTTSVDGTSSLPITIQGDGTAVLSGANSYGLYIRNDYYQLSNFIIEDCSKGLVIDGSSHGTADRIHVTDTQQEAFKLRNFSTYWVFTNCSARRAGLQGDYGEGFYVGQASSNWPNSTTPDVCAYVTFFNCYVTDTVNDGWDVKEGSHHVKVVNCTADYSGSVEPAHNAGRGSAGFFARADNVQFIKCAVIDLSNTDWGYRINNQTINGIDYGSTGNEMKQCAVVGGNVPFIFAESGTGAKVYTDCVIPAAGLKHASSSNVSQPSSGFVEMTWSGEGGGSYGSLDPDIGCAGDPLYGVIPGSLDVSVAASTDDARERTDSGAGSVSTGSALYLGVHGSATYMSGLRFNGVAIPVGATITSASIQFQSQATISGTCNVVIRGHKTANPAAFAATAYNISSRPVTTASASWSVPNWVIAARTADQLSPDLTAVVQELVDQAGWASGNSLVFVVSATSGGRDASAYDNNAGSRVATLHVVWE